MQTKVAELLSAEELGTDSDLLDLAWYTRVKMSEDLVELQMADQQIKQLQEYLENFASQVLTIQEILTTLKDFKTLKPGSKILVPLQNGIFVEAILGESKMLKMNVGSNTVVDKTVEESIEMMEKQLEAVTTYRTEVTNQIDQLTSRVQEIQQGMEKKNKKA